MVGNVPAPGLGDVAATFTVELVVDAQLNVMHSAVLPVAASQLECQVIDALLEKSWIDTVFVPHFTGIGIPRQRTTR